MKSIDEKLYGFAKSLRFYALHRNYSNSMGAYLR